MGSKQSSTRQRGIGPGASSSHVSENLKAFRKAAGIDLKTLEQRLRTLRRPMSASSINRIENNDRKVDADDLFSLAMALNVSPSDLLKPNPITESPSAVPEAFLWEEVNAWVGGRITLTSEGLSEYWEAQEVEAEKYLRRLRDGVTKMDLGQWSGKQRGSYEAKIREQTARIELARERQAFADSIGSDSSQYEIAAELMVNEDG